MKITTQIRTMALGLVAATALGVGLIVYWNYGRLIAGQRRDNLVLQTSTEARRLETSVHELTNDVRLLAGLPSIRSIIATRRSQGSPAANEEAWKQRLAEIFAEMLRAKPYYAHIRFIGVDDNGREIVRVDRHDGRIVRVDDEHLQKDSRDYFKEGIARAPGNVYLGDITLNYENGAIESPHRPMIRAVSPIYTAGREPFGIVVINMDFQPFVDNLFDLDNGQYAYYLTNDDGDYLLHPDMAMTYGFDVGNRHLVQNEFPSMQALFDSEELIADDGRVCFIKVRISPDEPARFVALGLRSYGHKVDAATTLIAVEALGFTVLLLLLGLGCALWLSRMISRPLAEITTAARRIAHDDRAIKLPSERSDEIGVLAGALNHMLDTLADNERRLAHTNDQLGRAVEDLGHFAHIASHDLREPARRIAGFANLLLVRHAPALDTDARRMLERLHAGSDRMLDQISDLRAFAQIGDGELVRKPTPIAGLVKAAIDNHRPELDARGVSVVVEDMPTLNIYGNLAAVLYQHLLDNTLRHAECNGFTLTFTARRLDDRWELGVRNTGSHIDLEQCRRVFAPFVRLERGEHGRGMGLAICRRIVERHAGEIHIEPGPDFVHVRFNFGKEDHDEFSR